MLTSSDSTPTPILRTENEGISRGASTPSSKIATTEEEIIEFSTTTTSADGESSPTARFITTQLSSTVPATKETTDEITPSGTTSVDEVTYSPIATGPNVTPMEGFTTSSQSEVITTDEQVTEKQTLSPSTSTTLPSPTSQSATGNVQPDVTTVDDTLLFTTKKSSPTDETSTAQPAIPVSTEEVKQTTETTTEEDANVLLTTEATTFGETTYQYTPETTTNEQTRLQTQLNVTTQESTTQEQIKTVSTTGPSSTPQTSAGATPTMTPVATMTSQRASTNALALPCDSQPCMNEGRCVNQSPQTFQCICPRYYTGDLCEIYYRAARLQVRLLDIIFIVQYRNHSSSEYLELQRSVCQLVDQFFLASLNLWPNFVISLVKGFRPGSTIADIDLQFTNESTITEETIAIESFSEYIVMNDGYLGNYTVIEILSADSTMKYAELTYREPCYFTTCPVNQTCTLSPNGEYCVSTCTDNPDYCPATSECMNTTNPVTNPFISCSCPEGLEWNRQRTNCQVKSTEIPPTTFAVAAPTRVPTTPDPAFYWILAGIVAAVIDVILLFSCCIYCWLGRRKKREELKRLQQLIQYRSDLSSSSRSSLYYTYGSPNYSDTYDDDTYSSIRSRTSRHSSETTDSIRPLPQIPRARFLRRRLIEERYSDAATSDVSSVSDVRNFLGDNFSFASDAAADSDGNVQYRWDFDVDRADTRSVNVRRPRMVLDDPYADSSVSTTSESTDI